MEITKIFQEIDDNIIGIDLAAKQSNKTGFAILRKITAKTMLKKSDDEIISQTVKIKPLVIAIDAPLSLPKGRCCVNENCHCRTYGISRKADRLLLKAVNGFL